MILDTTVMTRNKRAQLAILSVLTLALPALTEGAWAGDLPKQCSMSPERGDCKALFESAYYDQSARKCRTYINDGCGPVVPFDTLEACTALCETVPELRLTQLRKVDATPIVAIELEYPNAWFKTPQFVVRAGDKVLQTRPPVIRWEGERIYVKLEAVLDTVLTGELSIESEIGGQRHRVFETVYWSPQTVVKLLDRSGQDEGIAGNEELSFLVYGADTPEFRLNDEILHAERTGFAVGNGTIWRVAPPWAPGVNRLSVGAPALDGGTYSRTFTFLNLGKGDVDVGSRILFQCGFPGGRSGPSFDIAIDGGAVELNGQQTQSTVDAVDSEGWLFKADVYNCAAVAVASGKATITIRQSFFHRPEPEIWRTLAVSVSEGAGR